MRFKCLRTLLCISISSLFFLPHGENILYPADCSGVHNIKTEFGAKGDGSTDDSKAILDGLTNVNGTYQTLYFPNGTYIVSQMLEVAPWTILQGQSEAGTVIKLKDRTTGFTSKQSPQPMIRTFVGQPGGGMNMQFNIYINNFTINTGTGNPGAEGILFIANNGGGMDHITVISDDGDGYSGLDLTASWDGPQYSHHLTVRGFDYGISVGAMHYATTLEYVTVSGQKIAGIRHLNHPTTLRKLTSTNTVPAIINDNLVNDWDNPLLVLLDSDLRGGAAANCAIMHGKGSLFVRHVTTQGYKAVIDSQGTVKAGTSITEYSSMPARTLFGGKTTSLDLPIKETIDMAWDPLDAWTNIKSYQDKKVGDDWGPAIQAAIASGKTTIYFPKEAYTINSTVVINGSVRVFEGVGSQLMSGSSISRTTPMFRIDNGTSPTVFFDFISFEGSGTDNIHIEHASSRTVSVKHSRWLKYQSKQGAGDLFVDDAAGSLYYFDYPQKVFLRALNLESNTTCLFNSAADLVVLNHKTEGQGTSIVNGPNGRTEILGGLNYPASGDPNVNPAYINDGGAMAIVQLQWWSQSTCVRETRAGVTQTLPRTDGSQYMFYTAHFADVAIRSQPSLRQPSYKPASVLRIDLRKYPQDGGVGKRFFSIHGQDLDNARLRGESHRSLRPVIVRQ